MAYVLGQASFLQWDFTVTSDTLIPRPDTELFVEGVLAEVADELPDMPTNLEVCCGAGCVACALALRLPSMRVVASDIPHAALKVASRNIERHGLRGRLTRAHGDMLEPARALTARRRR